uniref:Uncharacterized protein n=2 Tax=Strombidium rassoulzadegani TaxID=1082188 RepID=A0A7S3CIL2_9SPIT|mmetsp:Transcript_11845/g.20026  ORF Transcript_11845/g.20026 Transcript_11845/m.20026 type:complete len:232 (+) Transcript_11845:967-1662(+)
MMISYNTGFIAVHLEDNFKIDEDKLGYYVSGFTFPYLFSSLLVPVLLKNVARKLQFVSALAFLAVGLIFVGPSLLLGLPEKLYLVMIGLCSNVMVVSVFFVQSIPEIVDALHLKYKIVEGLDDELDDLINDKVSGLYNTVTCLSSLICPIVFGGLYDLVGYRETIDIMMIFILLLTLIFAVFNCGFSFVKRDIEQKEKLRELQRISAEIRQRKLQFKDKIESVRQSLIISK